MDKTNQQARQQEIRTLKQRMRRARGRLKALESRIGSRRSGPAQGAFCARVDTNKCEGCGLCRDICPFGAVSFQDTARIDPERCTGCGRCVGACPRNAVHLELRQRPAENRIKAVS